MNNKIIFKNKHKKGFTLIELLVVVSILGLISSIIMMSIGGVRAKANDAKRKVDLQSINKAIVLFYEDRGYYPNPGGNWCSSDQSCWNTLQAELSPYIGSLPKDPVNQSSSYAGAVYSGNYVYTYGYNQPYNPPLTVPTKYDLITNLQNPKDPNRCQVRCYRSDAFGPGYGPGFCPGGSGEPVCPSAYGGSNQIYSVK